MGHSTSARTASGAPEQGGILLVTVTKVETESVLSVFPPAQGPQHIGTRVYFDLGTVNESRVWLTQSEMGAAGLGGALQTVSKGIEALTPRAVVMVGIAFGMSESRQKIGDVLVSEQLRLYDLQRVGTQADRMQIILRGDKPHAPPELINILKSAEHSWKGANVRFGSILTGEKLIDNVDFRQQLQALEPEAIGGEMEGAGLYVACQDKKIDWILIKSICDWADGHKDDERSKRQALAARNAAEFLRHAIEFVPWGKGRIIEPIIIVPPPLPPNNLPARDSTFRGRAEELADVEKALARGNVVLLVGPDGVGKTALALELAHRAMKGDRYRGGVWFVAADGKPGNGLSELGRPLDALAAHRKGGFIFVGTDPTSIKWSLQKFDLPMLLVLDGVTEAGWGDYLPSGAVKVLLTTRDADFAMQAERKRSLGPLSPDDARAVAEAVVDKEVGGADAAARDRVLAKVGGFPLAVELAAIAVKRRFGGAWSLYEELLAPRMALPQSEAATDGKVDPSLLTVIDAAIDCCGQQARALLEGIAVFAPAEIPRKWALAAAEIDDADAADVAWLALEDVGLVTVDDSTDTALLHRTILQRARERADREHPDKWRRARGRGAWAVAQWAEARPRYQRIGEALLKHVDEVIPAIEAIEGEHERQLAKLRLSSLRVLHRE